MTPLANLLLFVALPVALARPGSELGRKPVMGWNTWCTTVACGVDWCSSPEILAVASELKASGLQSMGYDHINLDDCWGVRDEATGEIEGDAKRFPEGMQAFIAKIHALGFRFGLYTDIDDKACHYPFVGSWGHYSSDAATFAKWKVDYVKFDGCLTGLPTSPGGGAWNSSNWGDGSAAAADFFAGLAANMSGALQATGRDMWLNYHCWNAPPGDERCAESGNSFRVYDDHQDAWDSTMRVIGYMRRRQTWWGANPGGSTTPSKGWPDPDFIFTGGQGCGGMPPAVPGAHAAPRCPGQTQVEYRTEFTLWALTGGSLVMAVEPRNMSAFQYSTLANVEVLAVFKDTSGFGDIAMVGDGSAAATAAAAARQGPMCNVTLLSQKDPGNDQCVAGKTFGCDQHTHDAAALTTTMWTSGECRGLFSCAGAPAVVCEAWSGERASCPCTTTQVWTRPLDGGAAAVALFNPTEVAQNATVMFSRVKGHQWTGETKLAVRDLWAHTRLATGASGSFTAEVEPHGTRLLRLGSP